MWTSDPPGSSIRPISESAVSIDFGESFSPEVQWSVRAVTAFLHREPFPGLLSVVPAYTSVTIFFDPFLWKKHWQRMTQEPGTGLTAARSLCLFLEKKLRDIPFYSLGEAPCMTVPVQYGGASGPDLREVAERLQMTENEVIELHTSVEYTVQMIGFLPGFPYLGPLPEALRLPRRDTPRLRVPPGSVAIAAGQTGIYPQASPGGWHLIGHTDFQLFDPTQQPPARLSLGDRVQFMAI